MEIQITPIKILQAQPEHLADINNLIRNSKSYWNYSKSYIEKAIPLLLVDDAYLKENITFEIRRDEELVGFFAFAMKNQKRHLDHLWITPSWIGKGIGRQAMLYTDNLAIELGWTELFTNPDPPAEDFYLKSGFVDTGLRIPSRIEGGPQFASFIKRYTGTIDTLYNVGPRT